MSQLHPQHLEDLRRSGLSDATIEMMTVSSLAPREIDKLAAGGLQGVESVLKFPYFLNGRGPFSRYKLFPPLQTKSGGTVRYYQPKDSACHLYTLPLVAEKIANIAEPLFIVEGEKKTAAAVQRGLAAIGIGGVWNWKEKNTW